MVINISIKIHMQSNYRCFFILSKVNVNINRHFCKIFNNEKFELIYVESNMNHFFTIFFPRSFHEVCKQILQACKIHRLEGL